MTYLVELKAKAFVVGEDDTYDLKLSVNRLRVLADKGTQENIYEEGETCLSADTRFIVGGDYY